MKNIVMLLMLLSMNVYMAAMCPITPTTAAASCCLMSLSVNQYYARTTPIVKGKISEYSLNDIKRLHELDNNRGASNYYNAAEIGCCAMGFPVVAVAAGCCALAHEWNDWDRKQQIHAQYIHRD